MPAALFPQVIDQPEERSSCIDDIARPVTWLSRPASLTAAPLMGLADPGITTPVMGPADLRTAIPVMGPADAGVTPLMCPVR